MTARGSDNYVFVSSNCVEFATIFTLYWTEGLKLDNLCYSLTVGRQISDHQYIPANNKEGLISRLFVLLFAYEMS